MGGAAMLGMAGSSVASAQTNQGDGRRDRTPSMVAPGLMLPEPFLALPFRRRDARAAGGECNISEGWLYGAERGIHGFEGHHAIDFNLPYGADILAPADGWAARTYQSWLTETIYQGKRIGFGLGLWLITLHRVPGTDVYWWTKQAHCSWIDPSIRYLKPYVDEDGDWHEPNSGPDNLYIPDPDLAAMFTPIKRGDVLARVGVTGVEWGYRDKFDVATGQVEHNPQQQQWDGDIHNHIEIYRRVNGSPKPGEKLDTARISADPFGQYGQVRRWQYSPYDGYPLGPGHLWLGDSGQLTYAG
jgi:hypothetical protein